jgi:hypothetical protein
MQRRGVDPNSGRHVARAKSFETSSGVHVKSGLDDLCAPVVGAQASLAFGWHGRILHAVCACAGTTTLVSLPDGLVATLCASPA